MGHHRSVDLWLTSRISAAETWTRQGVRWRLPRRSLPSPAAIGRHAQADGQSTGARARRSRQP